MVRRFVAALALLALSLPVQGGAGADIETLSWLSGQWLRVDGDKRWEEHYMRPAGGVIVGMSRSVRPGRPPSVEFIRIAPGADGRLTYHAHPLGQAPAGFPLVEQGPGLAVFANPAHDFPQRITYRLMGDELTATIEGPDGDAGMRRASWTWRRAGPAP
ncbi:DUF6265 family protein [Niveispirillum fermenti]|uniref:DUF6265 family protein n=1 Tax=Niveispirillum fermenti TaxID=1233113 RepID=UPI003A83A663